jgi:hypothetical protein
MHIQKNDKNRKQAAEIGAIHKKGQKNGCIVGRRQ